jgi:hypothetical protein
MTVGIYVCVVYPYLIVFILVALFTMTAVIRYASLPMRET